MGMIDAGTLRRELGVSDKCESCPRYDGRCKGHLSWMCDRIRKAERNGECLLHRTRLAPQIVCSECGTVFWGWMENFRYCANCGADMKGAKNDMTNAEAIETLKANRPDACYEQLREAVDKAIEALETVKYGKMTIKDISYINYNLGYLEGLIDGSGLPDDAKSSAFDVIQSIASTIEKERKVGKDGEA